MIGVEELVDEVFEGSCILRIYQAYVGSCKSISLSVEEILARKIGITESYFADESDEESDEENKRDIEAKKKFDRLFGPK